MVRYTITRLLVAGSSFFLSRCVFIFEASLYREVFFVMEVKQLYIREIKIVFYGTVKVDG